MEKALTSAWGDIRERDAWNGDGGGARDMPANGI